MSSSSNINCQRGTVDANRKRVGFFNFPKDPNLRVQWLQKIRRDVGTKFKLTEITNVCSLHFRESKIKKRPWTKEDECRRASPQFLRNLHCALHRERDRRRLQDFHRRMSKRRVEESFTEESSRVSSDITSQADDTVSLETVEIVNTESQCESLRFQLLQAQEETARLDAEVSILK